jgi:hypothetical protein
MKVDSVCGGPPPFGISPTPLEGVAPSWLGHRTPRARYVHFRSARGNAATTDE